MTQVTEADRDAAADWLQSVDDDGHTYDAIRRGQCDQMDLVQAFARHREQAVQEAVAERDARMVSVFLPAVLHGDAEHRAWLTSAVDAFIAGEAIPGPAGSGNKDAWIAELQAENARLRGAATTSILIVQNYLYTQREKVEDVPSILLNALGQAPALQEIDNAAG